MKNILALKFSSRIIFTIIFSGATYCVASDSSSPTDTIKDRVWDTKTISTQRGDIRLSLVLDKKVTSKQTNDQIIQDINEEDVKERRAIQNKAADKNKIDKKGSIFNEIEGNVCITVYAQHLGDNGIEAGEPNKLATLYHVEIFPPHKYWGSIVGHKEHTYLVLSVNNDLHNYINIYKFNTADIDSVKKESDKIQLTHLGEYDIIVPGIVSNIKPILENDNISIPLEFDGGFDPDRVEQGERGKRNSYKMISMNLRTEKWKDERDEIRSKRSEMRDTSIPLEKYKDDSDAAKPGAELDKEQDRLRRNEAPKK